MKFALITGITGMVGSHLTDYLLKNTNWKIYGLSRWRSPLDNIEHLLNQDNKKNSRVNFIYGDLNDYSSLVECIKQSKPNYVFHLVIKAILN